VHFTLCCRPAIRFILQTLQYILLGNIASLLQCHDCKKCLSLVSSNFCEMKWLCFGSYMHFVALHEIGRCVHITCHSIASDYKTLILLLWSGIQVYTLPDGISTAVVVCFSATFAVFFGTAITDTHRHVSRPIHQACWCCKWWHF